jgi:hypothetical protein
MKFNSRWGGDWTAMTFYNKATGDETMALVKGRIDPEKPTLVRMHTMSMFVDVFGEESERSGLLSRSMEAIADEGAGVIVVINKPMKGIVSRFMQLRAEGKQAGAPEILFVRLRGALAAVQAAKLRMSQDVAKLQSELIEQSAESAAQDWALCRDQALPFFTQHSANESLALWRLSVPQTAPVLNLPNSASETFIEWHGAQRWIWAPLSEAQQIRHAAANVGGQATLFRRPQQASAAVNVNTPVFTPLDTVQQRIQHALKNEFDPAGIFSPRRLNAYF